jgi:Transposase DDE domain group 1
MDQNRICCTITLACELTTWTQLLALTEQPARRWEPKRLRLRLFSLAGRLARSGRRTLLHLPRHAPWAPLLLQAITCLRALAAPGCPDDLNPGKWNRHPPERPRAHRHTHHAQSRREDRPPPVSITTRHAA